MATKTQKLNSLEIPKIFYEIKWLKQSITMYEQERKCLNQQKQPRLLLSEIELHGDKKAKNKTDEKNLFFLHLI